MLFFTPLMKDVHNKTFKIIFKNYLTLISWSLFLFAFNKAEYLQPRNAFLHFVPLYMSFVYI